MLEGWGFRALYDDASTPGKQASFVSHLAASKPSTIWLAIGTNDYGLNKWNAASFGSAYSSTVDALHAAMPAARIMCQTPLVRNNETTNASGSTLEDYRAQIGAICSARSWVTMVDGAKILTLSDLADGIHPTAQGFVKYAKHIAEALQSSSGSASGSKNRPLVK